MMIFRNSLGEILLLENKNAAEILLKLKRHLI